MPKGFGRLEGAVDTHARALIGAYFIRQRLAIEAYLAVIQLVRTGDEVDAGGFSRAVRADQRQYLPFVHVKGHVVDRVHAAKGDVHIASFQ